jgi:hypothetical protein
MTNTTDRTSALCDIQEGNIIHGTSPRGVSLVCFVKAVTKDEIITRRITGETIIFTRHDLTWFARGNDPSRPACRRNHVPDRMTASA